MQRAFYENGNEIPNHLIEQEMAAGRAFFDANDDVVLADQYGDPVTVKGSEVNGKLADGKLRFVPPAELQAYEQKQESESLPGMVRTGAAGLARGLTLGASDAALVAAGADPDAMRRDKEFNPGIATASELVGAVAPVVASGGAAAGGRLAGAAKVAGLAPSNLAARGAAALGARGEAALLRAGVNRGLAKTAGVALEGASEGAVAGMGMALSDASLQDYALSAETLLAAAGSGALLGGLMLGGLSAAGQVAKKAAVEVADLGVSAAQVAGGGSLVGEVIEDAGKRAFGKSPDLAERAVDNSVMAKAMGLYGRASGAALGGEGKTLQRLFADSDAGRALRHNAKHEEVITREAASDFATRMKRMDAADRQLGLEQAAPVPEQPATPGVVERIRGKANEMRGGNTAAEPTPQAAAREVNLTDYSKRANAERLASRGEVPDIVQRLEAKAKQYDEVLRRDGGLTETQTRAVTEARDAARAAQQDVKRLQDAREAGDMVRRVKELEDASMVSRVTRGRAGLVGGITGGLPGAVGGAAVDRLYNPTRVLDQMEIVEALRGKVDSTTRKVERSISKVIKTSGKTTKTGATGAAVRLYGDTRDKRKTSFERRQKQLIHWQQDRLELSERFGDRVIGPTLKQAAPALAGAMIEHHARSMDFLASKLPEKPRLGGLQGHLVDIPISQQEIDRFAKYSTAVERPMSVLEDLEDGQLTPEAVEAIQATHPKLYEQMRVIAMEKIIESKEQMPYQRKLQLSMLLDIPGDPSIDPAFMARTQEIFQQADAAEQQKPPPSRLPTAKPRTAEFAATQSEKVANHV